MNTRFVVALGALLAALVLPALASAQPRYQGRGRHPYGGYGYPPAVVVTPRPHPMQRPVVVVPPPRGGRYETPYGWGQRRHDDYGYRRGRRGWGWSR